MRDRDLSALLRQLLPLQALDGPLHARPLATDRVQSSPAADRDDSARDSDSGTLARARVAWRRLQQVAEPHRSALLWLAARAHGSDNLPSLAGLYAGDRGPLPMRDAVARTESVRRRREAEAMAGAMRTLTPASVLLRAAVVQALAAETAAREALRAWGVERIVGAWTEWEAAGNMVSDR